MFKELVLQEMHNILAEIPAGIDHVLRVLRDAETIMLGEKVGAEMAETISLVAILHDIGALEALRKYGSMDAHYQELEGPAIAREILERIGYSNPDRICYIIANHHTPEKIDGLDFQIQWEADVLDNLTYNKLRGDKQKLEAYILDNFKTATGRSLALERLI